MDEVDRLLDEMDALSLQVRAAEQEVMRLAERRRVVVRELLKHMSPQRLSKITGMKILRIEQLRDGVNRK